MKNVKLGQFFKEELVNVLETENLFLYDMNYGKKNNFFNFLFYYFDLGVITKFI